MKFIIVYTFRNRDVLRVKRTLDSMALQSDKDFEVLFIDYGSTEDVAAEVQKVVARYAFVKYYYLYTQYQPWSKSKALNYALKLVNSSYFFVADIDMIFHFSFLSKVKKLLIEDPLKNIFFKVGFLSKSESSQDKEFENYKIQLESNKEATGLTVFTTQILKDLCGFDEFYHFWGAEDTDVHVRLKNAGYEVCFYDKEILLLHQWHPSYRSLENKQLTTDLRLTGIVKLNHHHLKDAIGSKRTTVNKFGYGEIMKKEDFDKLENVKKVVVMVNRKEIIDHFLFHTLRQSTGEIVNYQFVIDPIFATIKYKIKKAIGKNVPHSYTLKEINDRLLLHLITAQPTLKYDYKIAKDLKSISLII